MSVRRAEDPRHVMRGSGEVVSIPASGRGWVGFEERCSHQCRRSLGKLGRHLAHDPPASSGTGGRFTSVGRSQTSSSGAGGGQWICGAILARVDSRAAPSTERARVPRAGWSKGWMATRSCKSRGEAVPNNVGFTTAFTVKKGHVEVPEWTGGRSCLLCFALFSPDAFPASFVPCPSAATPCSSLTFDFAQLPVWPSS